MPLPPIILADALGLILGFIFLLLFALAAVSSMQRKQEAAHRERIRRELEHPSALPPAPRRQSRSDWPILRDVTPPSSRPTRAHQPAPSHRTAPTKRPPPIKHPPPRAASSSQPAKSKQRKVRQAPASVAAPARPVPEQVAAQLVHPPSRNTTREITDVHQSQRAPAPATANAPTLAKWLTPTTMRSQFILTEILQKPIALREDQSK